MPAPQPPQPGPVHSAPDGLSDLMSVEFLSLCAISVLAFCNIAIFYGFYAYLTELGIPPAWRGPLLALEPLTALLVRPFLGRFLSLGNGVRFMRAGMALATLSLLCYPFAKTIPAIALVRMLHGLGFVTVVGGLLGTLTAFLPRRKSAQGFGLFSVTILLPYALMPPFVELVLPHLPGHGAAYALAAPLMLPAFLLLRPLGRRTRALAQALHPEHLHKPSWAEVRQGLRNPSVSLLIAGNLCLVAAHSIVFFFMRDFAVLLGAGNPGMFFTYANAATITLRVLGGHLLDRVDKGRVLVWAFAGLAVLLPLFGQAGRPLALFGLAALYGSGMALTMPLLNASMLYVSPPKLRAFNANLLMVAVDAGFFAGPFLGGMLLAAGWSHAGLFCVGGGFMLAAGLCMLPVGREMRRLGAEGAPEPAGPAA
ncbi:MAG: MFS transporter [Proteobacteria bacterium]|nr:MFS transporter [Pseudomonadota bacterium]MBU1595012.1 MFS transporter [Pseudomonadota bacterium]